MERRRYALSLDRVTGRKSTGGYFYAGTFSFRKFGDLTSAKQEARDEMKKGYFNHATIYDREEATGIECFTGTEWRGEQ